MKQPVLSTGTTTRPLVVTTWGQQRRGWGRASGTVASRVGAAPRSPCTGPAAARARVVIPGKSPTHKYAICLSGASELT